MTPNAESLIKDIFNKNSFWEVNKEELIKMMENFPYASVFRYFHAQKLKTLNDHEYLDALTHTSLFFNNKRWLYNLLNEEGEITVEAFTDDHKKEEISKNEANSNEHEIIKETDDLKKEPESIDKSEDLSEGFNFEPYHTIDYFASQGIKLRPAETTDKLGQKVKSFTEWLKTMKKIQAEQEDRILKQGQPPHDEKLDLKEKDLNEVPVITEAMAEIYLKQGLLDKAIEVYDKLSLQNPHNSHIFADRIKVIKENRP